MSSAVVFHAAFSEQSKPATREAIRTLEDAGYKVKPRLLETAERVDDFFHQMNVTALPQVLFGGDRYELANLRKMFKCRVRL